MRAARFYGPEKGIRVEEVPTPEPRPGEVRIRVEACGLCHTDLHYLDHGVPTFQEPPVILGHEVSGTIDLPGEGVEGWEPGTPVLVPAVLTCGNCRNCRTGRENICENMQMLGNHRDGGFAEYLVVPARELVRLPENIPLDEAAIIADALSTPYHAVKNRAQVRPGERVLVIGCGGIGLNLVQCCRLAGAQVAAVDIREEALQRAKELGAQETINIAGLEEPEKAIRRAIGRPEVVFEAVGKPETIRLAMRLMGMGGRFCVVGYCAEEVPLPIGRLMFFEQAMVGSLGCPPALYPEIVALVAEGRLQVKPLISGFVPLEDIESALNNLRKGEGIRWVIRP